MNKQIWMLSGLNLTYYATAAVLQPFLPLYFGMKGYTSSQIGLLMMAGPFVAIFAQPLWGYLSDRYHTLKFIIMGLWMLTIASSVGIFQSDAFVWVFVYMLLLYFFMLSAVPLLDSLTIKGAEQNKRSYGSIRLWGSIGFTAVAIITGLLLELLGGVQHIAWLYWCSWLVPLCLLMFLKDEKAGGKKISLLAVGSIVKNRPYLWFLLLVFLLMVPHRMNDGLFVLYLKDLGGSDSMAGWGWAIAAIGEVPVFALLGRYMHRFHEMALLGIVSILYTIRWLLYSWITDPTMLMAMQVSHSITFAVFWIVALQYAIRLVPEEMRSTGLALLSAIFLGLAGITGGIAGGYIKDLWGGQWMYLLGACMSALAAVLFLGTHAYEQKIKRTP